MVCCSQTQRALYQLLAAVASSSLALQTVVARAAVTIPSAASDNNNNIIIILFNLHLYTTAITLSRDITRRIAVAVVAQLL